MGGPSEEEIVRIAEKHSSLDTPTIGKVFKRSETISVMSQPDPPRPSIGEEFMQFAEKYWQIGRLYEMVDELAKETGQERSPYPYVRGVFVKKINDIIQQRING